MSENKENLNNLIHIIIVSSEYYAPYLAVLLKSLIDNKYTDDNLDIHIVSEDINSVTQSCIIKMFPDTNIQFKLVNSYEINQFGNCTLQHMKSNICNYKLKFAEFFDFDKAICLECDMVVLGSLKDLYAINIDGYPIAAVKDPCCNLLLKHFDIDPLSYHYFNTGLFVANFKYWRTHNVLETFVAINKKYKKDATFTNLLDQNIFNIAFYDKVKYLPNNAQFFSNIKYDDAKRQEEAVINPTIIHYAAPEKPWNTSVNLSNLFWIYARLTPFYEEILQRMFANKISYIGYILNKIKPNTNTDTYTVKYKIFNFITLFKKKKQNRKTKIYVLGLPIWKTKQQNNKKIYYLLHFIPLFTKNLK